LRSRKQFNRQRVKKKKKNLLTTKTTLLFVSFPTLKGSLRTLRNKSLARREQLSPLSILRTRIKRHFGETSTLNIKTLTQKRTGLLLRLSFVQTLIIYMIWRQIRQVLNLLILLEKRFSV